MTPKIFISDDPTAPKLDGTEAALGQLQRGVENAIVQSCYGMTPEGLHEPFGAVIPEIQIKWHDSAQAIHTAFMEGIIERALADPELEGITREDITEGGWELEDGSDVTDTAFLEAVVAVGYWGFSDDIDKIVHVWPGNLGSKGLAMLIGHEIGHLVGIKLEDDSDEEARADLYGLVAQRVVEMVQEHTPAAYRKEFIALTADVKDEREAKELWRSSWQGEYKAHTASIAAKNAEQKELQALLDREQAENARLLGEVERLQKSLDGQSGLYVRAELRIPVGATHYYEGIGILDFYKDGGRSRWKDGCWCKLTGGTIRPLIELKRHVAVTLVKDSAVVVKPVTLPWIQETPQ